MMQPMRTIARTVKAALAWLDRGQPVDFNDSRNWPCFTVIDSRDEPSLTDLERRMAW